MRKISLLIFLALLASCGTTSETAAPTTTTAAPTTTTAAPIIKTPAPKFESLTSFARFDEILESSFSNALNSEFEKLSRKMGISAAIFSEGKLWSEAVGNADETRSLTADTPLAVMSSSKTFLGALILNQIEDGLYGLDDYLPDLMINDSDFQTLNKDMIPNATVEQYLLQRSGGGGTESTSPAKFFMMVSPTWRPVDFMQLLNEPAGPPGPFRYADANSNLLGMLAEHMGGDHLEALYKKEFFDPLSIQAGLRPTMETPDEIAIPYGQKAWYGGAPGWGDLTTIELFKDVDSVEADGRGAWAGAGIVSTSEHMARWGYELYSTNGNAVSSSVRQQILDSVVDELVDGFPVPQKYGYQTTVRTHSLSDGSVIETYGHPGGGWGYSSAFFYSPELDATISILANTELSFENMGGCATFFDREHPAGCIARDFLEALSEVKTNN